MDQFTIKKLLYGIALSVLGVMACIILIVMLFASLWTIGSVIDYLNKQFGNSQLIIALIPAMALIMTAIISVRYRRSTTPASQDGLSNVRLYKPLSDDILDLLKVEEAKIDREQFKKLSEKHLAALAMDASESVLNHLYYIHDHYKKGAGTLELLFLCAQTLNAIRKTLGQKEIEAARILSVYRKETDKELHKRRERLSGVPHFKL